MSGDDPRSHRLDELTEVAYRLGLVFGQEAERAESVERKVEFFHLFDRCFFSVRVAMALQLRLRGEARRLATADREGERSETSERDAPERDGSQRYDERDRDRERETASLPVLLRTLESVAADAAALPGPPPAALPTLRELLAQVKAEPASSATPRSAPPALRSRLSGSVALTRPTPRPTAPIRASARRATGPP